MEMETYIELSILKFRRPSHITHTLLTPSTTNSVRSLLEVDSVAVGNGQSWDAMEYRWWHTNSAEHGVPYVLLRLQRGR